MSNYGGSCFLGSNFHPEPCVHLMDPLTAPEDDNLGLSHKQGLSIAQKTDVEPKRISAAHCYFYPCFFSFHIILHFLVFLLQHEEEEEESDGRRGEQRERSHFQKAFDSLLMRGRNTSLYIACEWGCLHPPQV